MLHRGVSLVRTRNTAEIALFVVFDDMAEDI